jgi:dihydroorotate dehydrogenase electron transfer subunit
MPRLTEKPLPVSQDHFLLRIESLSAESLPGQFINIRVSDGNDPLLRRPFSIFSHEGGVMSAVIKTVGRGTEILAGRGPGEIDVIGPLGNGFTIMRNRRVLIAGGGVGNAPLHYLACRLAESGCEITFLYGARSRRFIYLEDLFRKCANRLIIATDDGSEGTKGLVTEIAASLLDKERFDMIYACGPAPMMKAMTSLAKNIPIEISVENYFGCGIGLCSGCTIETADGPRRACVDGPVFGGAGIRWDLMPD